jgi:hypothetical protein
MIHQKLVPTDKRRLFLRSIIETGKKHGMISMTEFSNILLKTETISEGIAKSILTNYE